jgi:isopentenyl phosphate kinase
MSTDETTSAIPDADVVVVHGSGSVAHKIIGEFLTALQNADGYGEIGKNLEKVIFEGKPSEAELRTAMFGDEPL